MLKDFKAHEAQCKGKVEPPPESADSNVFRKKEARQSNSRPKA